MDKELKDYLDRILLNQTTIITCLSRFQESWISKDNLKTAFNETVKLMGKYNSI